MYIWNRGCPKEQMALFAQIKTPHRQDLRHIIRNTRRWTDTRATHTSLSSCESVKHSPFLYTIWCARVILFFRNRGNTLLTAHYRGIRFTRPINN